MISKQIRVLIFLDLAVCELPLPLQAGNRYNALWRSCEEAVIACHYKTAQIVNQELALY